MAQQAENTRDSVRDVLATTAHIYEAYPHRVEALAALSATHLGQEAAGSQSGDAGGGASGSELDDALAGFDQVFRGILADQQFKQIVDQLRAEYTPPPYTSLPEETVTEGEPITVTVGVAAAAIAAAAALGGLIGAAIPV